jgi:hypothetical protein
MGVILKLKCWGAARNFKSLFICSQSQNSPKTRVRQRLKIVSFRVFAPDLFPGRVEGVPLPGPTLYNRPQGGVRTEKKS